MHQKNNEFVLIIKSAMKFINYVPHNKYNEKDYAGIFIVFSNRFLVGSRVKISFNKINLHYYKH